MTGFWEELVSGGIMTFVVAVIAFIGVLISAVLSSLIARKSAYISSVTVERSKWLDKLRANISDLVAELSQISIQTASDAYPAGSEMITSIKRADAKIAMIKLQLNPRGSIDKNIIKVMDLAIKVAGKKAPEIHCRDIEAALIRHSQFLLKEEWEKVKMESRSLFFRPYFCWRERARLKEYQLFCAERCAYVS